MSKTKDQLIDAGFMQTGGLWIVPEGWHQEGDVVSFAQAREMFLQDQEHAQTEAQNGQKCGISPRGRTCVGWDDWN